MTEPSKALVAAAERRHIAEHDLALARIALIGAIIDDLKRGVKQVDVIRVTGYSREHVRRLVETFNRMAGA